MQTISETENATKTSADQNRMKVEPAFADAFRGKVHQAFFYVIDQCNLHCGQCLYKPELAFQMEDKHIPFERAVNLMQNIRDLGGIKMTFMGGEPTLYPELPELIHEAKKMGYEYVRIDTNGLFPEKLLDNPYFRELDEITFSLDGPSPALNDPVRGKGVFKRCTASIKAALARGYKVQITTCVHRELTRMHNGEMETLDRDAKLPILQMVDLAKELGVDGLNMHDLFKAGIPRDTFSGDYGTSIAEYMNAFQEVFNNYEPKDENGFTIRMPQCVTTKERFESNPSYYGYCSVKQYDRLLAFPNGMLRVCSLMIGSPYCIGYYDDNRLYLNTTPTNETRDHKMNEFSPCTCQSKGKQFGKNYVPLCVSFKPRQEEIVWVKRHKWEQNRGNGAEVTSVAEARKRLPVTQP